MSDFFETQRVALAASFALTIQLILVVAATV